MPPQSAATPPASVFSATIEFATRAFAATCTPAVRRWMPPVVPPNIASASARLRAIVEKLIDAWLPASLKMPPPLV